METSVDSEELTSTSESDSHEEQSDYESDYWGQVSTFGDMYFAFLLGFCVPFNFFQVSEYFTLHSQ